MGRDAGCVGGMFRKKALGCRALGHRVLLKGFKQEAACLDLLKSR